MAQKIPDGITSIQTISVIEHNVARINSISSLYKKERQKSKAPTFALTP